MAFTEVMTPIGRVCGEPHVFSRPLDGLRDDALSMEVDRVALAGKPIVHGLAMELFAPHPALSRRERVYHPFGIVRVWTFWMRVRVSRSGTGRLAGGARPEQIERARNREHPGPRSENDRAATAGTRSRVSTKGRLRILVPAIAARSWVPGGPGVRILRAGRSCSGLAPPANLPVPLRDTFASHRSTAKRQ